LLVVLFKGQIQALQDANAAKERYVKRSQVVTPDKAKRSAALELANSNATNTRGSYL
jgi:hypothetical protein